MIQTAKGLSLTQPWASLIADGKKTIETRRWKTSYRGPILICSTKAKIDNYPSGVTICLCDLVDIRPMIKYDEEKACCRIYSNAYSWIMENIQTVMHIPMRGSLFLFDVYFDQSCYEWKRKDISFRENDKQLLVTKPPISNTDMHPNSKDVKIGNLFSTAIL